MNQASRRWLFYGLVAGLNILMAGMWYVVKSPLPATVVPAVNLVVPRTVVVAPVAVVHQGVPIHISVPSVAIDLTVGVGAYDSETASWTVDSVRAYYANMSVPSNDHNGTTLIYGHAQSPVFARLPEVQVGAQAVVTTDTGYAFYYRYVSMQQVLPTDISVLRADGPPTLVLQTCMGWWDEYRGLFSFVLEEVEPV